MGIYFVSRDTLYPDKIKENKHASAPSVKRKPFASLLKFISDLSCQHCSLCPVEVKDLNSIGKFRKNMYQDDDSQVGEAGD